MTTTLWLAPGGVGRTHAAIARVVAARQQHPGAPIWVVVATERQRSVFRQRLLAAQGPGNSSALFNVHVFTFTGLYSHLLAQARHPTRRLGEVARLRLLRQVALREAHARGQASVLAQVAGLPGFARALAGLVNTLKQSRIDPHDLRHAARQAFGGTTPKDDELAAIYQGYQDVLRHHDLVDRDGEGWLALTALQQTPELATDVPLLVVDGFDVFTLLRADVLAALGARVASALITLVHAPADAVAGQRFVAARAVLEGAHARAQAPLVTHVDDAPDPRPAPVRALAAALFSDGSARPAAPHHTDSAVPDADAVTFLEAPDEQAEVALALRVVKRRLLGSAGQPACAPEDFLVVLRDWPRYAPRVAAQAAAYRLPVALHAGGPVQGNPAVAALLAGVALHAPDAAGVTWPHDALVDVLRTPYLLTDALPAHAATLIDLVARRWHVNGGRAAWLAALHHHDATTPTDAPVAPLFEAWFAALTPPPRATVQDCVAWLDALIGADPALLDDDGPPDDDTAPPALNGPPIHVFARARAQQDAAQAERDGAALHALRHELRALAGAHTLVGSMTREDTWVRWQDFAHDLRDALAACTVARQPSRAGRILVTDALEGRGLPHDHVVILGLAEGVFPQVAAEDPFYLDDERVALSAALRTRVPGASLPTLAERSEDDGIFYELVSLAQSTLTLSRPTVQDGAPWPESALWRAARAALPAAPLVTLRPGDVVPPGEAASLAEWLVGVADGLRAPSAALPEGVAAAYNALLAHQQQAWARVRDARAVEVGRSGRAARPSAYSGQLESTEALAWAARAFGPGALWSATRLNELALCAYGVFVRYGLKLEPLPPPQDGMDPMQRGDLLHRLLAATYALLQQHDVVVEPQAHATAIGALDVVWDGLIAAAPRALGFRPSAAWAQEQAVLRAQLEALLHADFIGDAKTPGQGRRRRVLALEHSFGRDVPITIDAAGTPLLVRGTIDRVDAFLDDNTLLIIDYKANTVPTRADVEDGKAVQTLLYRAVAQHLWAESNQPAAIADSVYWSISTPTKAQGLAKIDANAVWGAVVQRIARARTGDFTSRPSDGPCRDECALQALCRARGIVRPAQAVPVEVTHDTE